MRIRHLAVAEYVAIGDKLPLNAIKAPSDKETICHVAIPLRKEAPFKINDHVPGIQDQPEILVFSGEPVAQAEFHREADGWRRVK